MFGLCHVRDVHVGMLSLVVVLFIGRSLLIAQALPSSTPGVSYLYSELAMSLINSRCVLGTKNLEFSRFILQYETDRCDEQQASRLPGFVSLARAAVKPILQDLRQISVVSKSFIAFSGPKRLYAKSISVVLQKVPNLKVDRWRSPRPFRAVPSQFICVH